jgi:hypothetical protein
MARRLKVTASHDLPVANSPAAGAHAAAGALSSHTAARLLPAMAATAPARVLPIWAGAHF